MRAIAVDDEIYMLATLQEAVSASPDIEQVATFSSCSAALKYAGDNSIDVAFLDINMRGMGGLGLAEKLIGIQPGCRIVFCTGHTEYAVSAFQLHVSGYIVKPITPEAVQREIDHIKGTKSPDKLLNIKCFGNFEVLYKGESLPFKRTKAKELLAVLVDRTGAGLTVKQICAIMFPEDTDEARNAAHIRQLVADLKNTLKMVGAEDVLHHDMPYYRIDTDLIDCDYYSFLDNGKPEFYGEYMTQYGWAETTCATLHFKSKK